MNRCITPIPPLSPIKSAMAVSVTVSMLALITGMLSRMEGVNRVDVSTSLREETCDRLGTSNTSSKVSPLLWRIFMIRFFLARVREQTGSGVLCGRDQKTFQGRERVAMTAPA